MVYPIMWIPTTGRRTMICPMLSISSFVDLYCPFLDHHCCHLCPHDWYHSAIISFRSHDFVGLLSNSNNRDDNNKQSNIKIISLSLLFATFSGSQLSSQDLCGFYSKLIFIQSTLTSSFNTVFLTCSCLWWKDGSSSTASSAQR
jgi:hypothetical protein